MLTLDTDVAKISRVGTTTAKRLKKLGLETARDLLWYFPFRYDNFSQITAIKDVRAGQSVNIVGQIELIQSKRSPRKRMHITEALVRGRTGSIKVIWFNQPYIKKILKVGDVVSLAGKVDYDFAGLVMKSPVYEKIGKNQAVHTQGIVPNYHLTANLTQKQIRFLIKQVIKLADKIVDWLPAEVRKRHNFLSLSKALKKIHFPQSEEDISQARQRLAFDELFFIQLRAQLIRRQLKQAKAQPIDFKEKVIKDFVASLPFELTNAQRKAAWQIIKNMADSHPMARLLIGDVGSGKTVVAVMAALNAVWADDKKTDKQNPRQAVLMVPTEILAQQHFASISRLLNKFNIRIGLFTRTDRQINFAPTSIKTKKKTSGKISKKQMLNLISQSKVSFLIGTHALIQEQIEFKNLVLAIIDEQHRFGVAQRKQLVEKSGDRSTTPHLLSMTATPIPRSLALALFGDLDISIIDELPRGRKKIITRIVDEDKRAQAYDFIRAQIKAGRQAFVICPLIDVSDKLGVASAKQEFEKLSQTVFPEFKIAMLHGRMSAREKEKIMADFLANKIQILVSTSVVEVGVDVPNATIMMIEGAERFGLAQLHQFRGRVGRSQYQSYCLLFTESLSEKTQKRLYALTQYNDGFKLAQIDLKLRGPGDVYGTAQKGFLDLKVASIFDYQLTQIAQTEAKQLIEADPDLKKYPVLAKKIKEWEKQVHWE